MSSNKNISENITTFYNCSDGTELIIMYLPNSTWKYTITTFMLLISFIATFENTVILFVLIKLKTLNQSKSLHMLIGSLALSDLLAGGTVAPTLAAQLCDGVLAMDCRLERFRFYMVTITVGTSVCTLGVISYDRYLRMVRLLNYKMSTMKLCIIITICWAIPILAVIFHVVIDAPSSLYGVAIVTFLTIVSAIVIGSYISTLVALRQLSKHAASSIRTNLVENERRVGFTVLIVLTGYMATIIPLIIHYSLLTTSKFDYYFLSKTYVVALCFSVANSIVNPVIIGYRTNDIKNYLLGKEAEDRYNSFKMRVLKKVGIRTDAVEGSAVVVNVNTFTRIV